MGHHASADRVHRLAAWPIVLLVTVVLAIGAAVGYTVIVNGGNKAGSCSGHTSLSVAVSTGAARSVSDAAAAFNASAPVARSNCVSVTVNVLSGALITAGLANGWQQMAFPAPGLWVADSAPDVAAVDATNSAMTAGHPSIAIATSPVVLAVKKAPTGAVTWAGVAVNFYPLVLGVPDPIDNRASTYALEALIAAGSGHQSTPLNPSSIADASAPLRRLAGLAAQAPTTTTGALTQLAAGTSSFTAVPVVESDLAAFNASRAATADTLKAIYPTGPSAGDQVLTIPLTAPWVTTSVSDAAAAFDNFLTSAKGTAILTAAALRTTMTPATARGVDLTTEVTYLPDVQVAARTVLARDWLAAIAGPPPTRQLGTSAPTAPPVKTTAKTTASSAQPTATQPTTTPATPTSVAAAPGAAVTFVLDASRSMNMVSGTQKRIQWVQSAVNQTVQQNPSDLIGIWSFSTRTNGAGFVKTVSLGPLSDQVNGQTRSAAITAAVTALTPGGDSWSYAAIQAAYADAVGAGVTGRANRVVVITSGLDATPDLSRNALKSRLATLKAQDKDVVLDIIGLSTDVNVAAMTDIAESTGGTFTLLSNLTDLQPALAAVAAR